ncbi:MAG: hypothetical protein LBR16_01610 [Treponema sp.]|jgi:hypothetical protein|nr:hypothetical protein [Treponema sp.]
MKRTHGGLSLCLALALLAGGCGEPLFVDISIEYSEPWLIMVYMAGANSLESEGVVDLNNMELGLSFLTEGEREKCRVVALYDRIKEGTVSRGTAWKGTRLYEVLADSNTSVINSRVILSASVGGTPWRTGANDEEHMGNKETLRQFVGWAREQYPQCTKQALILWNHGGGVAPAEIKAKTITRNSEAQGVDLPGPSPVVCTDDEDYDAVSKEYGLDGQLFIAEIQEVLEKFYSEGSKLDLLGFDDCDMAMYEIAYQFRKCASYMAAAPGLEYKGWNYSALFQKIMEIRTGRDFAEQVARTYQLSTELWYDTYDHCLSAFDLSVCDTLKEKVDTLAAELGAALKNSDISKAQINAIREAAEIAYFKNEVSYTQENKESVHFPFYDLGSLCDAFITGTTETAIQTAAQDIKDVLAEGVLFAWKDNLSGHSPGVFEGAHIANGMSIFFSRGDRIYERKSHYAYHWFYTNEDTNEWKPGYYYGHLEAANSNCNGTVETWRELLEYMYDPNNTLTPGTW